MDTHWWQSARNSPETVSACGRRALHIVRGALSAMWLWMLCPPVCAVAQTAGIGEPIVEVQIEQEGRAVTDPLITGLIETRPGTSLSMKDVRETIEHLNGLQRFNDVQVFTTGVTGGVSVRYVLVPMHTVQQVEFRGELGLSEGELRQAMTERYGSLPSPGRANDVANMLQGLYRERGYAQATVTPRIEEFHNPDRATLIFSVTAGPRAALQRVDVDGIEGADRAALLSELAIRVGQPYDSDQVRQRIEKYEIQLRSRGYYEARVTHSAEFTADRGAILMITVDRGPLVSIVFSGDPLPPSVREQLVPIRREASVDEDLLEDATRAIEDYLKQRGYREARCEFSREERADGVVIDFHVTRGARYLLDEVTVKGSSAFPLHEIISMLRAKTGEPFVQSALETGVTAVREKYRSNGYTHATVEPVVSVLPRAETGGDRHVEVTLNVAEGPRTLVGSIAIEGNTVMTEGQLREVMQTLPGKPLAEQLLTADRDRIELEYRNRGYESVAVERRVTTSESDTRADVRISISEGPQSIVDHVIIIGNERTSTATIERELSLKRGQPLGYSALIESQQRLSALGLFRRVRISELKHTASTNRDILVQVEEAPPTTVGYGGGLEGGTRLRPTAEGGQAEERFEIAPRGFVEIGRRNLWGKNRALNLFTRVSLRARDVEASDTSSELPNPPNQLQGTYGFNEYRVLAVYREPKIFNTRADVLFTGILEQAIRSSFNYINREVRAEAGLRLNPRYSVAGRYSYQKTKLFDEHFTEEEKPLIDRLFPQVRLSTFTVTVFRDTRDDGLDPNHGTFLSAENNFAARLWGSEVGFAKTYLEALHFVRLPTARRTVLALAGRLGAAHGFPRQVPLVDPTGEPILGSDGVQLVDTVKDLPASERFFAGGDTTVRGFTLDRLGTPETISPSGFPTGGNGLVVLNTELRVALFGGIGAVGFVDAGNVFAKASDISLADIRGSVGFGVRYRSPVGPIRVDWGFKLNRLELIPGQLERGNVLHISLGQAF